MVLYSLDYSIGPFEWFRGWTRPAIFTGGKSGTTFKWSEKFECD